MHVWTIIYIIAIDEPVFGLLRLNWLKCLKALKSKHVKNQFKSTFKIPTLQIELKVTDECQWWMNN